MTILATIMNGGIMPTAMPMDFKLGRIPHKYLRPKVDETCLCSICGEICETEVAVFRGNFLKTEQFIDAHPRCITSQGNKHENQETEN